MEELTKVRIFLPVSLRPFLTKIKAMSVIFQLTPVPNILPVVEKTEELLCGISRQEYLKSNCV